MLQMVLVRPGATVFDQQGRIQGTLDIPLCAEGTDEVGRTIQELQSQGIEAVYSSQCEPALQTAEALAAALGLRVKRLDHMQNLNHGLWQGMQIDEVRRKHPKVYRQWQEQPTTVRPPEGEMLAEALERVRACVKRLLKKHKQGTIAVVVPEPLATIFRSHVCCAQLGDLWKAGDEHGRWEVLTVAPQGMAAGA